MLKLTVAVPIYNVEENIERAIKSCSHINLDKSEYEILVVDNCSTDNSMKMVEKLKEEIFENIVIYKNKDNIGRVRNWNRCLELARGKYLIFLFGSDEINNNVDIKQYLYELDKESEISLYKHEVIFDNKNEIEDEILSNKLGQKVVLSEFIENNFIKKCNYCCFGILQQHIYRTDVIRKNNIRFDEKIPRTTDRVFIFEVINSGNKKFLYNKTPLSIWHISNNRFHNKVHNKIYKEQIKEDMDILWGNEVIANKYILKKYGYSDESINYTFYKHYSDLKIIKFKKIILRETFEKEILTVNYYKNYLDEISNIKKIIIYIQRCFNMFNNKMAKVLKVKKWGTEIC